MILGVWLRTYNILVEKKDISESYNRYEDESYQKKIVSSELKYMGYDWECMDYGLFDSVENLEAHLKSLSEDRVKDLQRLQDRLKGIKTSD